jgi:hypothetical protein
VQCATAGKRSPFLFQRASPKNTVLNSVAAPDCARMPPQWLPRRIAINHYLIDFTIEYENNALRQISVTFDVDMTAHHQRLRN